MHVHESMTSPFLCFACICEVQYKNEFEKQMLMCKLSPVHATGECIMNLIDCYMAGMRPSLQTLCSYLHRWCTIDGWENVWFKFTC